MNAPSSEADICIVVEGCYPFVAGGVSSWLDWLIRSQSEKSFCVVSLVSDDKPRSPKYELPENVVDFQVLPLARTIAKPGLVQPALDAETLADLLYAVVREADLAAYDALAELVATPVRGRGAGRWRVARPPTFADLTVSEAAWQAMVKCYRRIAPHAGFADFFWAWRHLVGGLMSVLTASVPRARIYHSISTGYAGLYAVRAARQHGQRAVVTEHGIYTNERRIDLVMADWIVDSIEFGPGGDDGRTDIRGFWIETFESFARLIYSASDRITTLYGANQSFQRALGATDEKLEVIPNGIVLEKFNAIRPGQADRPTAALIGRVVPIKDIESYIAAAAVVRRHVPDVAALVIGPTDEDEEYFHLCQRRVRELGLEDVIVFTGKVNVLEYLPRIDVLVLTSISEAQPLVLLEAGAARVPCVTTDVGSCREIIEGAPDEMPRLGIAGRVAPPMDAEAIGTAIVELLRDESLRRQCGETLRRRVERYFTSETSAARYNDLYRKLVEA